MRRCRVSLTTSTRCVPSQLPEWLILRRGVQMHTATFGLRWVYGYVIVQQADTIEQYKNVSSKNPGGLESRLCCPRCLCTRCISSNLDLHSFVDKERRMPDSVDAIETAAPHACRWPQPSVVLGHWMTEYRAAKSNLLLC